VIHSRLHQPVCWWSTLWSCACRCCTDCQAWS